MSYATIARFRAKLLGNATKLMRGRSENTSPLKDLGAMARGVATNESIAAAQRDKLQQVLAGALERRLRWTDDAENRPILDKTGQPIIGADGKPMMYMEHRALAAHDRNLLSALELQAKMDGILAPEAASFQVNAVIVLPSPAAAVPIEAGSSESPSRQVVDVDACEIDASR